MTTGRPRTGTVFFNRRVGRWTGAVSLGGGQRRWFYGASEAAVRAAMAEEGHYPPKRMRRPYHRDLARRAALTVLERATALGWDREMTAAVLAASLTKARVRRGIIGPCVYCGDELADTVDHVVALAVGGTDDPDNVVSCCLSCNVRKGKRDGSESLSAARTAVRDFPARVA